MIEWPPGGAGYAHFGPAVPVCRGLRTPNSVRQVHNRQRMTDFQPAELVIAGCCEGPLGATAPETVGRRERPQRIDLSRSLVFARTAEIGALHPFDSAEPNV